MVVKSYFSSTSGFCLTSTGGFFSVSGFFRGVVGFLSVIKPSVISPAPINISGFKIVFLLLRRRIWSHDSIHLSEISRPLKSQVSCILGHMFSHRQDFAQK